MANRPIDMNILCPSGYNALKTNSYMTAIKEGNGYEAEMEDAEFLMDCYELTQGQVNQIIDNLKEWNKVIPSGWGTSDDYLIPVDVVEELGGWGGNIFLNDVADSFCGELGYDVFILSTEDWGML